MATNKPVGDNARKGAVKGRSQVQNPKRGLWVKRDAETGKFMDENIQPETLQRNSEGEVGTL